MDDKWNVRLRKAREAAGLTLKEVSASGKFNMSQQSLIKYEKGDVFPRIDYLDYLCKLYHVTVDYVLYGSSGLSQLNDTSGQLVSLFSLLNGKSLTYLPKENSLRINDRILSIHIMALDAYIRKTKMATIDDLTRLIYAIEAMSKD